ncbi:hypothetical protein M0R45_020774 [Rubus argutus]|uniref:Uncharacterized protein n=1 Tax=Rubus argutus TaxID=59490 RepID=A0AAW1XBN5_RUBAR
MGTEILRPQDCLIERIRVPPATFSRRKSYYCENSYPMPLPMQHMSNHHKSRKPVVRAEQRRPKPAVVSKRSGRSSSDDLRGFKTEKVTILRRGESLNKLKKVKSDSGLATTDGAKRLGLGAEMVPREVRIMDLRTPVTEKPVMYAGSAFAMSPEPSSLPLPSFSRKKQVPRIVVDDAAARDLRRLLRLE